MKSRTRKVVYVMLVIAVAFTAVWSLYAYFYLVPSGPALPPQPPDRRFSKEVVALNNQAIETQDTEAALQLYDKALKIDPKYYMAYANKAQMLLYDKRHAEAVVCFERLAVLRPRTAEYYVGHAFCLQRQDMDDKARDQLFNAISAYNYRMEKSPFHSRLNRAMVLFLLGREFLARRELDELADQWPDHAAALMVPRLRQAMDDAAIEDRWSILGFDK